MLPPSSLSISNRESEQNEEPKTQINFRTFREVCLFLMMYNMVQYMYRINMNEFKREVKIFDRIN